MDKPPCSLDELFSFDNLKKYIEFIEKKDRAVIREIADVKIRMREIDSVNRSLTEVNKRIDGFLGKVDDINNTLKSQQNKMMELESNYLKSEEVLINDNILYYLLLK